jgi:quinolinate synthase
VTTAFEFTEEVAAATDHIYEKVKGSIPRFEWEMHAPLIAEINRIKKEKNAVILGHNYMVPEIFHGVSDFVGDSLGLSIMADVRLLKERYPGVPVVTYVNTPAAIKAESDICCTSANAVSVVESLGVDRVIFLPDEYLGRNVANQTDVSVITWAGRCIVHEQFTVDEIRAYRAQYPDIEVIAHPECSPEVCAECDFVGSTTAMIDYLDEAKSSRVIMVTECSMSDNVAEAHPEIEFVRPCTICPHMKKITLGNTLASLQEMKHEVFVEEQMRLKALRAVERMLEIGRKD